MPTFSTTWRRNEIPRLWFTEDMATFRYVVADVFTDAPLAGNQVAVFTDAREIPEEMLQPLARELP